MKKMFKPLALATAVASTGYMAGASAQDIGEGGLGDMAIIPYYTVEGSFQTGIHIINTTEFTQVVKLRFRRASDSMDALDINLVMSPKDVWTGNLNDDFGPITLRTDDTTCTVPERSAGQPAGVFEFPALYREGAEEGYIEVIAMAEPDAQVSPSNSALDVVGGGGGPLGVLSSEATAIAEAAKHVAGVPRDCGAVRENFFSQNTLVPGVTLSPGFNIGNVNNAETQMFWWENLADIGDPAEQDEIEIDYRDSSDNALRVSWFLRDTATGLEFGDEAVHVEDFLNDPAMTNQQFGLFSGDVTGFDYPDLNGGVPLTGAGPGLTTADAGGTDRGQFLGLRSILGVSSLLNDWSTASERNVSTDWVVTFPGQYTMVDYEFFARGEALGNFDCGSGLLPPLVPDCDFRDLPIVASLSETYDREEGQLAPEEGELVVSPSVPGEVSQLIFPNEVNVIEWTNGANEPVLGSSYTISIDTSAYAEPFGWAQLAVARGNTTTTTPGGAEPRVDDADAPALCDWDGANELATSVAGSALPADQLAMMNCANIPAPLVPRIPMVGFVAWERSFPSDPSANYGRIIPHASTP